MQASNLLFVCNLLDKFGSDFWTVLTWLLCRLGDISFIFLFSIFQWNKAFWFLYNILKDLHSFLENDDRVLIGCIATFDVFFYHLACACFVCFEAWLQVCFCWLLFGSLATALACCFYNALLFFCDAAFAMLLLLCCCCHVAGLPCCLVCCGFVGLCVWHHLGSLLAMLLLFDLA